MSYDKITMKFIWNLSEFGAQESAAPPSPPPEVPDQTPDGDEDWAVVFSWDFHGIWWTECHGSWWPMARLRHMAAKNFYIFLPSPAGDGKDIPWYSCFGMNNQLMNICPKGMGVFRMRFVPPKWDGPWGWRPASDVTGGNAKIVVVSRRVCARRVVTKGLWWKATFGTGQFKSLESKKMMFLEIKLYRWGAESWNTMSGLESCSALQLKQDEKG